MSADEYSLLGLLADIRAAAGDREGRLMQPELVEHIRGLKARADEADRLRAEVAVKDARIAESDEALVEANKLLGEFSSERDRLRAEVEALRAKIDHAEVPPKGKPEFLEWVATELAKGEALDWVVAQGIAATLRGQAYLLRVVAAQAQAKGD